MRKEGETPWGESFEKYISATLLTDGCHRVHERRRSGGESSSHKQLAKGPNGKNDGQAHDTEKKITRVLGRQPDIRLGVQEGKVTIEETTDQRSSTPGSNSPTSATQNYVRKEGGLDGKPNGGTVKDSALTRGLCANRQSVIVMFPALWET